MVGTFKSPWWVRTGSRGQGSLFSRGDTAPAPTAGVGFLWYDETLQTWMVSENGGAPAAIAGGGGGPSPSASVVDETAFGQASAVGVLATYSRGDHSHGTPTDPVPAHVLTVDPHTDYLLADGSRSVSGTLLLDVNARLAEQAGDPAAVANTGFVYAKDVAGVTQLFYRDSAGSISQLTPGGSGAFWTLDGTAQTVTAAKAIALANVVDALSFDGATLSIDALNGFVGFGTPAPLYNVEVMTTDADGFLAMTATGTTRFAGFFTQNLTDGSYAQIDSFGAGVPGTFLGFPLAGASRLIFDGTGDAMIATINAHALHFGVASNPVMTLGVNGFVSIGDTSATDMFTVGVAGPFRVDVSGVATVQALNLRVVSPAAMAVTENAFGTVPTSSFVRLTPNALGTALNGIIGGVGGDRMLTIVNLGPATITVNHQAGTAAAADRIVTSTGAAVLMLTDDTMILMYDSVTARWRQIGVLG